jgi:acetyl-CoA carboxylase carboxyltransferase component
MFFRNTLASGVIPQISAILGPSAGAAVYSPALTDFVIMVKGISQMFVTGPDVVKAALGEVVTFEDLGGASVHAAQSGVAHFVAENEQECFLVIRKLLSFLPQNSSERPPSVEGADTMAKDDPALEELAPSDPNRTYDMRKIVRRIVDAGDYLEVHAGWAQSVTVGFARIAGMTVGIVANQPMVLSGALDVDSSNKAARFVRFCDSFNIPILTLVDVPGYLPGADQEHRGLIRNGSKLLYAYCEATVPKVTLIVKKAYGGAYCAMGSKYSKADINLAWPGAEIAVMGPEGAINIIYRREIEASPEPDALRKQLAMDYRKKFANPYVAAGRGIIDEVVQPSATRGKIISSFESLKNKSEFRPAKKHGNIQL